MSVGSGTEPGQIVDTEGTYTRWLKEAGVLNLIARPDFYVYATAVDGTQLQERIAELAADLHLNQQPVLSN